jgi:hypothetical protein
MELTDFGVVRSTPAQYLTSLQGAARGARLSESFTLKTQVTRVSVHSEAPGLV